MHSPIHPSNHSTISLLIHPSDPPSHHYSTHLSISSSFHSSTFSSVSRSNPLIINPSIPPPSIHPSIHTSLIHLSTHPVLHPSINPFCSFYPSLHPFPNRPSTHPSIISSIHLSYPPSIHQFTHSITHSSIPYTDPAISIFTYIVLPFFLIFPFFSVTVETQPAPTLHKFKRDYTTSPRDLIALQLLLLLPLFPWQHIIGTVTTFEHGNTWKRGSSGRMEKEKERQTKGDGVVGWSRECHVSFPLYTSVLG